MGLSQYRDGLPHFRNASVRASVFHSRALHGYLWPDMRCGTGSRGGRTRACWSVSARREGDTLVVSVRDDGRGLTAGSAESAGVGLANTRARLAALYGDRASLEVSNAAGGGIVATVRLPYPEVP
jgi:hypothetical protein